MQNTDVNTLSALFRERVRLTPERIAYRYFEKQSNNWQTMTWQEVAQQVTRWQAALQKEGLQAGDKVAIMARNSPHWVIFDQAAMGLGLITVPLYADDSAENVAYILDHAEVKLLCIDTPQQWQRLYNARDKLTDFLQHIITLNQVNIKKYPDDRIMWLENWLPTNDENHGLQEKENAPDDLTTIVYTSGTTGRPKGVMLSHRNILSNAKFSADCVDFYDNDVFLSFLPLSHMLERTAGYYLPMLVGAKVAYARSIQQLASDLTTCQPTILISVPRIYEQVYNKIQIQLEKANDVKKLLFNLAVSIGWKNFEYQQKRRNWSFSFLLHPLLHRLVAKSLLEKLGGHLRLAICGGAALPEHVGKLFVSLGLDLEQGYGLTEASPVIMVNRPQNNIPQSIGIPLPNIQAKLGNNDELLTKSECVMLGYWKNEAATQQMIDKNGWLHTGDKAEVDDLGHWYITGRIKDIIVMGNGEKVPPADMEMAILSDPLFEQVMLVGEGRPYLAALVVLNETQWQAFANKLNLASDNNALQDKTIQRTLLKRIGEKVKDFPSYAQIRRVHATLDTWSVDNGLLTPTLKVKRAIVTKQFADEIEKMYEGF